MGAVNTAVAIIDGGVDYNHPDLSAAMWINEPEANGITGVDDDGNGTHPHKLPAHAARDQPPPAVETMGMSLFGSSGVSSRR